MKKIIILMIAFVAISFFLPGCATKRTDREKEKGLQSWVTTWSTSQQLVEPGNMPPAPGLTNNTLRQTVRVSIGGDQLRLHFSNIFSKGPATFKSVAIAVSREGSIIDTATQKMLTFGGNNSVTIPAESEIYSDPLAFHLVPGSRLAITIHFGETSPTVTGHPGSRTTSFILEGDKTLSEDFTGSVETDHWYMIQGIDVKTTSEAAAIVALGNSITDGRGSGTNKQNRWTDILSERLLGNPKTKHYSVLNAGIGGNCVLHGGLGPTALDRFDRDVLSQSGVRWLIILEGINDIGGIRDEESAPRVAQELIDAYTLMIEKAHAHGIKVYGGTILPFAKSFYDTPFRQEARNIVNEWICSSGKFDAVIDFDKVMRSPDDPKTILPDVHSGDFLHPDEAGYKIMGDCIDLGLFD